MTGTDLPLVCQLGECRRRAALTFTIELPTEWSESREYNVRTLLVAVCGDCARELEDHGRTLIAARVQYGRLREKREDGARVRTQLVALVEAVGPPYEPVHDGVFGRWLAGLDQTSAQAAWRLLAHVKRTAIEGTWAANGRPVRSREPDDRGPGQPAVPIEVASFRRQALVPPMEPVSPRPAAPPSDHQPQGGDDAA